MPGTVASSGSNGCVDIDECEVRPLALLNNPASGRHGPAAWAGSAAQGKVRLGEDERGFGGVGEGREGAGCLQASLNGGCHPSNDCMNTQGSFNCAPCPNGFVGSSQSNILVITHTSYDISVIS